MHIHVPIIRLIIETTSVLRIRERRTTTSRTATFVEEPVQETDLTRALEQLSLSDDGQDDIEQVIQEFLPTDGENSRELPSSSTLSATGKQLGAFEASLLRKRKPRVTATISASGWILTDRGIRRSQKA